MDVRISPLVELKEARSEIGWLRNRTLILAQALQGEIAAAQSREADHADD